METGPVGSIENPLTTLPGSSWLEPIPDVYALPASGDPGERAVLRQSIRLAFVAALQHLPPRPRAVVLLIDVLGWPAADVADTLAMTVPAVTSALQRARISLATHDRASLRAPVDHDHAALLERYVDAFERYDLDALTNLLHADATMSMPPYALWLQGRQRWRQAKAREQRVDHDRLVRLVRNVCIGNPTRRH